MTLDELKITLRGQLCLPGFNEDALQALVDNLQLELTEQGVMFVTSTGGIAVKFLFDSAGNFQGAYAQMAGVSIPIIFGTDSKNLQLFEGPPSPINPGQGWEVDVEATQRLYHHTGPESGWDYFVGRRKPVLSTIP